MQTIEKIKTEVARVPAADMASFRGWFAEFDAENWDAQFERDVAAGKLDRLAERAIKQVQAGRCTSL